MFPLRIFAALSLVAILSACGGGTDSTPSPLEHVETLTVAPGGDGHGHGWDGVVEAVNHATLAAQTHGRVTAVHYDINDRVQAGAVLLRFTAVEQQAGANSARALLRAAEASAVEAESNYQRFAALEAGQYVSKAQIDQARAVRDAAAAARDAARAQLVQAGQQTEYTVVRAPYAGIIASRDVEPGETVASGQTLMTLYAPGALRIEVRVPQSDAEAIRARPEAAVLLDDGRRIDAAQVTVFPSADPASHSVAVRIGLPELEPAVAPGTTAKVVFAIGRDDASPSIPVSALVRRSEITGVYVLSDDGRLGLRQLRLGPRIGDGVEVVSGLKAGERIAADPIAAMQALAKQHASAGSKHE